MDQDRERRIHERAYALWQSEGRPEGRHEEHWRQAREAVDGEDAAAGSPATSGSVGTEATGSGGASAGDSGSA